MTERLITEAEVEAVLADPVIEYDDPRGARILIGYPGGRGIKVVVAKDSQPPVVITVAERGAAR